MRLPPVRRTWVGGTLTLFVLLLVLARVPAREGPRGAFDRNVGELTGAKEVGVAVRAARGSVRGFSFRLATYGRQNTAPVVFELRASPEETAVLRTLAVDVSGIADHETVWFRFQPVRGVAGKTLYASLRSPASIPGNAVTVAARRVSAGAGLGMTVLLREGRRSAAAVRQSQKETVELAYGVEYSLPLADGVARWARDALQSLVRQRTRWWLDARLFGAAVLLACAVTLTSWRRRPWLGVVGVASLPALGSASSLRGTSRLPMMRASFSPTLGVRPMGDWPVGTAS